MLPVFIKNLILAVNSASRVILKLSTSTERAIDGIEEVAVIALNKTKQSMLNELTSLDGEETTSVPTVQQ